MENKKALLILMILLISFTAFSQSGIPRSSAEDSKFSLKLNPGLSIPLGEDADIFKLGGGADLSGEYKIPFLPLLFLSGCLGYNFQPIEADTSISILTIGAGAGANWEFIPKLCMGGYARGGYFYAFLNDKLVAEGIGDETTGGGNPFLVAGINLSYMLSRSISLGIGASYRNLLGFSSELLVSLGASYHFQPLVSRIEGQLQLKPNPLKGLTITDTEFEAVFPVFFKYYDKHPIGKAVLHNGEQAAIEDIKVSLFVEQYMYNPKICKAPVKIEPGDSQAIELYGLFTDKVLDISESTMVSAQIVVECTMEGKSYRNEHIETIRLYDKNAVTWDDDRKAAAFVTMKDPTVLRFSRNVSGMIKDNASKAINANLLTAMGMHEALSLYGMSYVIDPSTPYKELSKKKLDVDNLQFPKQTLGYKAGDCDDLSILYCALLESVGVETAFVTIPGHIYMALSLDMDPAVATKQFLRPEDLIIKDDNTWLPVEVTEIGGGFLKAWEIGARQWREHEAKGQAGFFPIHEAWEVYEPVGYSAESEDITFPSVSNVVRMYMEEVNKFIDREIYPRVSKLEAEIRKTGDSARSINRLGVLYARYGLNDKAEMQFRKILQKQEYVHALINMGNIYYLSNDMYRAAEYYERASRQAPDNPIVLLSMARVNHAIENYGSAKLAYEKLKNIEPDLAERFSYLDLKGEAAARAADVSKVKEEVIWEEE